MSRRLKPITAGELESRLADLFGAIAFPVTPDLASSVGSRLRAQHGGIAARPRMLPLRRSARRSLLLAATLVLLVVATALAVGFGLKLLSIERGPVPTAAPASATARPSAAPGARLGLGHLVSLEEAAADVAFYLLIPEVLGPPDAVYFGDVALRGQVAFVYAPRDNLPVSPLLAGAGLLVTENQGKADPGLAHKLVDSGRATVEPVDVNGAPGVWISGAPHIFWYLAADGTYVQESRRVVGDTLAWERDGVLYRIEGAITLQRAMDIARSLR